MYMYIYTHTYIYIFIYPNWGNEITKSMMTEDLG